MWEKVQLCVVDNGQLYSTLLYFTPSNSQLSRKHTEQLCSIRKVLHSELTAQRPVNDREYGCESQWKLDSIKYKLVGNGYKRRVCLVLKSCSEFVSLKELLWMMKYDAHVLNNIFLNFCTHQVVYWLQIYRRTVLYVRKTVTYSSIHFPCPCSVVFFSVLSFITPFINRTFLIVLLLTWHLTLLYL